MLLGLLLSVLLFGVMGSNLVVVDDVADAQGTVTVNFANLDDEVVDFYHVIEGDNYGPSNPLPFKVCLSATRNQATRVVMRDKPYPVANPPYRRAVAGNGNDYITLGGKLEFIFNIPANTRCGTHQTSGQFFYWDNKIEGPERFEFTFSSVPSGVTAGPNATVQIMDVHYIDKNSPLIPSGLSKANGTRFRYLLVPDRQFTEPTTATPITTYDQRVRNEINNTSSWENIENYSAGFQAVVSTDAISARNHTGTVGSGGVRIYWLKGSRIGDNYGEFWDGDMPIANAQTSETGALNSNVGGSYVHKWTGSTSTGGKGDATPTATNLSCGSFFDRSGKSTLGGAFTSGSTGTNSLGNRFDTRY